MVEFLMSDSEFEAGEMPVTAATKATEICRNMEPKHAHKRRKFCKNRASDNYIGKIPNFQSLGAV